jgi:PAP2 superfamily
LKEFLKRGIAITVVWVSVVGAAAAAVEVSPREPSERDVITLKVQRSFTEDCQWEVTPRVRRERQKIDVTLDLRGSATCDQALTNRTFEVPIGPFPPGRYVLSVRWSDKEGVESQPLTIAPARAEARAAATFVVTGPSDSRLPPPLAEEQAAGADERRFLAALTADFGSPSRVARERAAAPIFWNELTAELGLAAALPPPRLARAYALVQVSIADALQVATDARRGRIDEEAAAAGAASSVLLYLFAHDSVRIRDAAASRLEDHLRDDVRRGFLLGRSVGRLVVRHARSDGAEGSERDIDTRPSGGTAWVGRTPVLPSAGGWKTWITTSGAEFEASPPYPPGSADDLREVEQVYRASLARTPEQIAAVRKWADWPPPTLWNDELNRRLATRRWPLAESARASAYLNAAMFDAFVACWRSKYAYWTPRPYMRLSGRTPMFTTVVTTPNFPSYTSGHSTVSGAAAVVLAALFPEEAAYFHGQAEEAAASRLWGGIHFQHDNDEGLAVGRKIGQKAAQLMRHAGAR